MTDSRIGLLSVQTPIHTLSGIERIVLVCNQKYESTGNLYVEGRWLYPLKRRRLDLAFISEAVLISVRRACLLADRAQDGIALERQRFRDQPDGRPLSSFRAQLGAVSVAKFLGCSETLSTAGRQRPVAVSCATLLCVKP